MKGKWEKMKDCVGKDLNIGDKVICSDMHYADLLIGEIVGITPKKARVRYVRSEYQQAYGQTSQHEQLKETYQIFKYKDAAQPTVDVVEVVRCKDCIHWWSPMEDDFHYCRLKTGLGGLVTKEDYCSFATRTPKERDKERGTEK